MPLRLLIACLVLAVTLSGCGRRGPLEPPAPPQAPPVTEQPVAATEVGQAEPDVPGSDTLSDAQSPGAAIAREQQSPGSQEPAEAVPADPSKRRFVLDFLI